MVVVGKSVPETTIARPNQVGVASRGRTDGAGLEEIVKTPIALRRSSSLWTARVFSSSVCDRIRQVIAGYIVADQRRPSTEFRAGLFLKREPPRMNRKRVVVVKKQALQLGRDVDKEHDELDYIVNKISTTVDFIALRAQETIDDWKAGKAFRRSSLEDLKFKFRLDTFSVQDGWGLCYMYPEWIKRQRQKIVVLLSFLGTESAPDEGEINLAIDRAQRQEWANGLDMDMDVMLCLKEMRKVMAVTKTMERRLKELEAACRKRSDQILCPEWEPRGLL
jgi:hypothetical protein